MLPNAVHPNRCWVNICILHCVSQQWTDSRMCIFSWTRWTASVCFWPNLIFTPAKSPLKQSVRTEVYTPLIFLCKQFIAWHNHLELQETLLSGYIDCVWNFRELILTKNRLTNLNFKLFPWWWSRRLCIYVAVSEEICHQQRDKAMWDISYKISFHYISFWGRNSSSQPTSDTLFYYDEAHLILIRMT